MKSDFAGTTPKNFDTIFSKYPRHLRRFKT
jgi:hypothetical protein